MEKWHRTLALVAACSVAAIGMGQTWTGDTLSWHLTDTSATLNATAAGTSMVTTCPGAPGTAWNWHWRWVQDLAGSPANRSAVTARAADSSLVFSLSLGASGSDDPLVVDLPDTSLALQPGTWAGGLDAEFRLLRSPDAPHATLLLRAPGTAAYTPLTTLPGSPHCWSIQAWYTASNTQNFSFHLHPDATFVPDTLPPRITATTWLNDTLLRVALDEPVAQLPQAFLAPSTGLLCAFPTPSAPTVLHCLAPAPPATGLPLPLLLQGLCDTTGNCTNRTVPVPYLPPHGPQPGDVAITEIMADPTPSLGLPEIEWIEWTNTSDRIIDVRHLMLQDASDLSAVEPLPPWDGRLDPGVSCVLSPAATPVAPGVPQAQLPHISSFTDAGERLTIQRTDGTVIDDIAYDRSWWQGAPGGTSAELRHTGACGLPSHWGPGQPASPGASTAQPAPAEHWAIASFHPFHASGGEVAFSCELDPLVSGSLQWKNGGVPLVPAAPNRASWTGTLPQGPAQDWTLSGLRPCLLRWQDHTPLLHRDAIGSFPQRGDAAVTEIAVRSPSGWPGLPPFVEWTNISNKTLEISGVTLNDFPAQGRHLGPGASTMVPLDLPNEAGTITLTAGDGTVLEAFDYSSCWQPDRQAADEGISWVRRDPYGPAGDARNWSGSSDPLGCSPGQLEPHIPWVDTVAPTLLAWVEHEGQIHARFSEPVTATGIPGDRNGLLWHFPSGDTASVTCRDFSGNERTFSPSIPSPSDITWRLNEVGAWMDSSDEPFLETVAAGSGWASTADLVWTTEAEPLPFDWEPVTAGAWRVPAGIEIAWARCPERLETVRALPTDLPSLYGDRTIQLGRVDGGTRVLLDSMRSDRDRFDPQRVRSPSTSWERFHAAPGAWAACLSGTTPGAPNSQSNAAPAQPRRLHIAPGTCVPGTSGWGQIAVRWRETTAGDLTELGILDEQGQPVRELLRPGDGVPVAGGVGTWFWDGRSEHGVAVAPGMYWVVAHGADGKVLEAEVVVVAPAAE